jgi:YD repeat-containing protein
MLTGIQDLAENARTMYAYDKAGRKVLERFEKGGVVYQDNRLVYDAQGRLTDVVDSRHHVSLYYDAVGNRRSIQTNFTDDSGSVRGWRTGTRTTR